MSLARVAPLLPPPKGGVLEFYSHLFIFRSGRFLFPIHSTNVRSIFQMFQVTSFWDPNLPILRICVIHHDQGQVRARISQTQFAKHLRTKTDYKLTLTDS
jgi:hypothetical protein